MARRRGAGAAVATPQNQRPAHKHLWRPLERGHRPGGSDDDPEVGEEHETCQKCGELRSAPTGAP